VGLASPQRSAIVGGVFRRFSATCLLGAWLCASGAMLDLTQVVAWARMFGGYARTETLAAAAQETFDPEKPCALCLAVSKARTASERHGPAVPSAGAEKMLLIVERSASFVAWAADRSWPRMAPVAAPARAAEVPVPPPRAAGPIGLC
jgi:hypothetical protein